MIASAVVMPKTGFFVDQDGWTRRVECPGDGLRCEVNQQLGFLGVDLIQGDGEIIFQGVYHESILAIESLGCTVKTLQGDLR